MPPRLSRSSSTSCGRERAVLSAGLHFELAAQDTGAGTVQVVLFEADEGVRSVVSEELRSAGCAVAPFADARLALLFVLGRLEEVDGVVVNVDESGQGAWLLRRLRFVPAPLSVATYSARVPTRGAELQRLMQAREIEGGGELPIRRALAGPAASA